MIIQYPCLADFFKEMLEFLEGRKYWQGFITLQACSVLAREAMSSMAQHLRDSLCLQHHAYPCY